MTQLTSPSSDELLPLPAVPRRRDSRAEANEKKEGGKAGAHGKGIDSVKRKRESARARKKSKLLENIDSDGDEDDEDDGSEPSLQVRRASRGSRRTLQRKISDDDDDDDDEMGVDEEEEEDDREREDDDDMDSANSDSESPRPTKRKRISTMKARNSDSYDSSSSPTKMGKRKKKSSSGDSISKGYEEGTDDLEVSGRDDLLAQLEKEAEKVGTDEYDSDDSEIEKVPKKKSERLTSRQRAMQGEKVKLEYTKLESPKSKKQSAVEEEWSQDEEMELKRQQKARLRQMINEKRNKEKRAAMVDKVLRGVTSKRKKITMASEARAAQAGTRLSQNVAREGCIRFVSNQEGFSISLPKESEEPSYLDMSMKASYPRACTRDPRTGKRIFVEAK